MKKEKRNYTIRYFIELSVILLFFGIIAVNSLYIDGYNCTKLSVNDGLITDYSGYIQENNEFKYNSKERCYIQIPNFNNAKEILFDFENIADDNIDISVFYIDSDNHVLDNINTIKWEKGTQGCKLKLKNNSYVGYMVVIPADFTINGVFYAVPTESRVSKWMLYILVIVLAIAISSLGLISERLRRLVEDTEKKVINFFDFLKKNRKRVLYLFIASVISIFVSIIVTAILEKIGKVRYNWKVVVLVLSVIVVIESVIFLRKYFSRKIEIIGFATILFVGTIISILEPTAPGISWDDETHYGQSVAFAHIFERKQPLAAQIEKDRYARVALNKLYYNETEQEAYKKYLDDLCDSDYYVSFVDLSQLVTSPSVVAYIPSAVGIMISSGLNMPYHIQFIIGKWMNVLLLAILCYYAMKKLKSGKLLVLLIALIPTNIFIASNYSYDTWLTGWSLLGLCTFFGEIQRPDEKISKKSICIIFVSMLLAVMPKMVYFPLTFIVFFMPRNKFSSKKDYWKYKLLILINIAIPFVFVLIKNVISVAGTTGQGDMRGGEDVDSGGQIAYILSNPLQTFKTMFNFLKDYLNPWIEGREYINNLAYNGLVPYYKIVLLVILVSALVSRNEKEEGKYPWWFRSGVVLVYVGIGALAAIALYISFTPVGSDIVAGCQGRYIIPALFPTLFVLTRFSGRTYIKNFVKEENINCLAVSVLALFSLYGMWMGCVSLY